MLTAAFAAGLAATSPAGAATVIPPVAARARQLHEIRLTAVEMFQLAEIARARGDLKTVGAIYAALESNPDSEVRAEARFRHAKQYIEQNRNRDAALLLRRVLDEKPEATAVRLELAHVLQVLGDSDGALRELRAAQAAGLPASVARIVDRYSEALRAARPTGASFEIAIAPDSNINHATRSDTLGTVLGDFDIDQDSKARAGLGLSMRGQAYRRFQLGTSDHNLLVRASGYGDLYARTQFNDIAVDLAAGPELRIGRNQVNLEIGATQRWFGQKPFVRSARVGATLAKPLGNRMQLRLSGSASLIDNEFNDVQDGKAYSGQIGLERALSATTGIAMTLAIDRQSLKDPGYSATGWRGGITGWRDIGRATLTAGLQLGRLEADERLALFPHKRQDRFWSFSVGATFRQLTFGGFAPIARLTVERNKSSVEFYDYSRTRTEVAIVRAF
jgi:tetratricopeptide (TPR) repeat protein